LEEEGLIQKPREGEHVYQGAAWLVKLTGE